jgi:hypothetical protein
VLQGSLSVTLASGRTYAMSSFTTSESATAERCLPIKQRDGYAYGLIYLTSDGVGYQQPIPYVPYEDWRGVFDRGTRPSGKPQRWTIKDSMRVEFDPTPDATYTFTCDVKVIAQTLATGTNSDLANYPTTARGLPAQYHDVVVWRAVKYYALTRQELSNLYQMADREERRILEKMRRDFTPEMYLDESIYDFGGF